MSERYAFPLRYDENFVRSCVWGFVARALFRENAVLTFAPLALIAFSCAMLFFFGRRRTCRRAFARRVPHIGNLRRIGLADAFADAAWESRDDERPLADGPAL